MPIEKYQYREIYNRIEDSLEKIISEWWWYFSEDISANDYYKIVSSTLKRRLEAEAREYKDIHEGEYIEIPDRIID